jgi:Cu/Ag efflux protein CusF
MASAEQMSGTVQKYDKDSKELTLANSDKKLKLSADTKVMKGAEKASAADIKEGDQVRASYSGEGDVKVIEILPADTTAPSK